MLKPYKNMFCKNISKQHIFKGLLNMFEVAEITASIPLLPLYTSHSATDVGQR